MSPDEEFVNQVADAYEHLYDIVYLRTHPLAEMLLAETPRGRHERAWKLHHLLLNVIEELDPGPQAPTFSREWRRHRLMVLHYVDGLDPQTVADRLAISRRTYYREHRDAIEAVASLLADKQALWTSTPQRGRLEGGEHPLRDRLELLRLEATRLVQRGRYAQLPEVIHSAVRLVQELAKGKGVHISAELEGAPTQVAVDRNTIRQILLCALSYLVEHLSGGEIYVRAAPEGKNVLLSLQSQGCRMAHRSADEAQNQVRLSMLEELAKVQKVRIDPIAGDDEVITGFRLMLPTERPRTVLVVDDNEDALQLLQRYLSQRGYEVIAARTGAEAIALAKKSQPYAITLDLMMPDQDGWDVLQTLANQPETRHIPVIVCTVLSAKELALSLGAAFFLEKPITEKALISTLRMLDEG